MSQIFAPLNILPVAPGTPSIESGGTNTTIIVQNEPDLTLSTVAVKNTATIVDPANAGKVRSLINPATREILGYFSSSGNANSSQQIRTGLIDPLVFNLGAGAAVAVGCKDDGSFCRITDPLCVSQLNIAGYCDELGTVTIKPRKAHIYEGTDFGIISDWGNIFYAGQVIFTPASSTITRPSGSWITDGFKAGMLITPSGTSTTNDRGFIILNVTDLTLTVDSSVVSYTGTSTITTGTDNLSALTAMLNAMKRDAKLSGHVNTILPMHLSGNIAVSDTLHVQQGIYLYGDGRNHAATIAGVWSPGTSLIFPTNVHGLVIHGMGDFNGASPVPNGWVIPTRDGGTTTWINASWNAGEFASSANSTVSNISFYAVPKQDNSGNGITVFAQCHLSDIQIEDFGGDGLAVIGDHTDNGGNNNGSQFERFRISNSGGRGLFVSGGDSNVGSYTDFDISGTFDYGVYETQTVGGNYYRSVQTAGCGSKYGTPTLPGGAVNHGQMGPFTDYRFDGITSVSVLHDCYTESSHDINGRGRNIGNPSVIVIGGILANGLLWKDGFQPFIQAGGASSGAPFYHYEQQAATSFSGTVIFDPTAQTITRSTGSWITDGFRAGKNIRINGTTGGANDGRFLPIATVSDLVLTLASNAFSAQTSPAVIKSEHNLISQIGTNDGSYWNFTSNLDNSSYWQIKFTDGIQPTAPNGLTGYPNYPGAYTWQANGDSNSRLFSFPVNGADFRGGYIPIFQKGLGIGEMGIDENVYDRGTAPPGSGYHRQGDYRHNQTPVELGSTGNKYIIRGWICTVNGSPGTWLEDRGLTGN